MTGMNLAVQQGLPVLLGTLPLVFVIGWAAIQQNARLAAMEHANLAEHSATRAQLGAVVRRLDRIDQRLDRIEEDQKNFGASFP
jgi:hypothetical protein